MSTSQLENDPHGANAFGVHQSCHCQTCESYREAVRRLVNSFSTIPAGWIHEVCKHREFWLPLPMWGTLFIPRFESDSRAIQRLLTRPKYFGELEQDALIFAGWKQVPNSGVWGIQLDSELLLGIHGAGYDFYEQHWSKLYGALGYHWHHA